MIMCLNRPELLKKLNSLINSYGGDEAPHFFDTAHDPSSHCYIFYDGLYYDAEEPLGVSSPAELPLFMRQANRSKQQSLV